MKWNWNEEKRNRWLTPAIEIPWLAEQWRSRGLMNFLDSGCGPGRHALYFARHGFRVTALDQSEEALEYLTETAARERLELFPVLGDIFQMPFPDESFDCILDYNVSYHTDTQGYLRAIGELKRVLRPGGEVYLTILSQNDPGFQNAQPGACVDGCTRMHAGETPHFYAARQQLDMLFRGFAFVVPVREIKCAGIDSQTESIHYHLLLRKQ